VAGLGKQEDRVEPKLQGRAGLLKDGPNGRMQVIAAPLARERTLSGDRIPLGFAVAPAANVTLAGPNLEKMLQARIVIGELLEKLLDGGRLGHGVFSYALYMGM